METGARIKYHRKKQQLELSDLAADLLLPSELKKIELGEITPSPEILKALCENLKIPLAPIENPIGQELITQFKELLLHPQDKRKIREHYHLLTQHPLLNIDEELEMEYHIQLIRFFVVTGDLESAEDRIKELENLKEFMTYEQYYLFHKYWGNFYYLTGQFEEAINLYLLAEKIAPASLIETECGDLYYSIAISASQLFKNELADKYSKMALAIYEEEFIPKRIVECHINLGITQQRMSNVRTALDHMKIAIKIGKKLNIGILNYTAEYNCGYFYFLFEGYDSAIQHFESALEYLPKEYVADVLQAYNMLIKSHFAKEEYQSVWNWINQGEILVEENNITLDTSLDATSNHKFKEAFLEFRSLRSLVEENFQDFEHYAINYLVPILKATNNYNDLGFYYAKLGNVYFKLGKYKKSAIILNEAQQAYKRLVELN